MFVILNVVTPTTLLHITQFLVQFNSSLFLQSMALLKISKNYSNNFNFYVLNTVLLLAAVDSPMRLNLYLKDHESVVVTLAGFLLFIFCLSLLNFHRFAELCE